METLGARISEWLASFRQSPLELLEQLLKSGRIASVSQERLIDLTRQCFQANAFSAAIERLNEHFFYFLPWIIVREALDGECCDKEDALRLLSQPDVNGVTPFFRLAAIAGDRIRYQDNRDVWQELMDILQGERPNLDHLILERDHQNPLSMTICARWQEAQDHRGLVLLRRLSPSQLTRKMKPRSDSGTLTTVLHYVCEGHGFSEEEQREIILLVSLETICTSRGPYGRTPLLAAAAAASERVVHFLLDILPTDALLEIDDLGCTLLHYMISLKASTRARIMAIIPGDCKGRLCSQRGRHIDESYFGTPAAFHLIQGHTEMTLDLMNYTTDEALFANEWICTFNPVPFLHLAVYRTEHRICEALFGRLTENYQDALFAVDGWGYTPLQGLVVNRRGNVGHLSHCDDDQICCILSLFLRQLTDDQLMSSFNSSKSVVLGLARMLSEESASFVPGLWICCLGIMDRLKGKGILRVGLLLDCFLRIPSYSLYRSNEQLEAILLILQEAAGADDFLCIPLRGSLYALALCEYPNAPAAKLLLEGIPREFLCRPSNDIAALCCRLFREEAKKKKKHSESMLELLLPYVPRALLMDACATYEQPPSLEAPCRPCAIRQPQATAHAGLAYLLLHLPVKNANSP